MKRKGTASGRKWVKVVLIAALAAVVLLVGGAGYLFRGELGIIQSIQKVDGTDHAYFMKIEGDYYFEEFLASGGASSDQAVSAFLTEKISKGFYSVNVDDPSPGCSTIAADGPDGTRLWGRNYDWTGSVPIIVACVPDNGYASISTCDFQNVTGDREAYPEGMMNKMLAIAALYVPMDGMNEAGLCVADLEVNEGGMADVNTEKPDLTVTTAIRLLLNRAATVEEAVALLEQYDIHPSGGISHHIAVSDARGRAVSIEFVDGKMIVVDTNVVTNFNLANGDVSAGGESAQRRYEYLQSVYEEHGGILEPHQVRDALAGVSQAEGEWTTQWSIVYDQEALTAEYYFGGNYTTSVLYTVH